MRTFAFLAFFMAMFAMLCSSVSAETATGLEPRGVKPVGAAFEATLDLLVKAHSDIVFKAYADVCTDANLATDVSTNLNIKLTAIGIIDVDFGLRSKLSAALQTSIKAAVKAEVDAEIKAQFTANLRTNLAAIITKRCPTHDAACIKVQAKNIVKDAVKLTTKASVKISAKLAAKLNVKIKAAIDAQIKKFSINLIFVKISVTGDVNVSKSVVFRFKAAVDVCAKVCADISAKEVSKIKAIASA
ncbi:hypothetical protein BGX23_003058 [Mortierella sp. AD031]|nr:hypothetical protein BGX23_003058 [Mortierella sp. AD031]KAG0212642.1 hypothetical protein BGX33_003424 [Mortierella sp. NVP41]